MNLFEKLVMPIGEKPKRTEKTQGTMRRKTDIVKFVRYYLEIIFRRSICRYIHSTRIVTVCCFQYQNRLRKRLRAVLWKNLSATYSDRIRVKGKRNFLRVGVIPLTIVKI